MGESLELFLLIIILMGLSYALYLTKSAGITLDRMLKRCDNIKKHINEIYKTLKSKR